MGRHWDTRGGTAVAPRLTDADPASLVDASGENLDPDRVWSAMMANENPGNGERSVAVGTLDMPVWDAPAKIAGEPVFRLLAQRHGARRHGLDPDAEATVKTLTGALNAVTAAAAGSP